MNIAKYSNNFSWAIFPYIFSVKGIMEQKFPKNYEKYEKYGKYKICYMECVKGTKSIAMQTRKMLNSRNPGKLINT